MLTWLLCSRSRVFKHSFRFANIVVNFPFLVFYGFIFAISIFQMESIREMQNVVSADHLIAYVFGVNQRYSITTTEPKLDAGTGGL